MKPSFGTRSIAALAFVGPTAMWIGLLGPAWIYIPSHPPLPSTELNFAGLAAHAASGIQSAYFGWLAWLFAAATTVLAVISARATTALTATVCAVVGGIELIVTFYGVKGPASWSFVYHSLPNTRLGEAATYLGPVALLGIGALGISTALLAQASPLPRQPHHTSAPATVD